MSIEEGTREEGRGRGKGGVKEAHPSPMASVMGWRGPVLIILTSAAFCRGLTRQATTVGMFCTVSTNNSRSSSSFFILHKLWLVGQVRVSSG